MFTYLCVAAELFVASAEGFREFGDCAVFTDQDRATCQAVTSSDNPLDFVFRANLSNYFTNFDARITLRGGNCGDASQVKKRVTLMWENCVNSLSNINYKHARDQTHNINFTCKISVQL